MPGTFVRRPFFFVMASSNLGALPRDGVSCRAGTHQRKEVGGPEERLVIGTAEGDRELAATDGGANTTGTAHAQQLGRLVDRDQVGELFGGTATV